MAFIRYISPEELPDAHRLCDSDDILPFPGVHAASGALAIGLIATIAVTVVPARIAGPVITASTASAPGTSGLRTVERPRNDADRPVLSASCR